MRRWWIPAGLLVAALLVWWLWPGDDESSSAPAATSESTSLANEGALPETLKPSAWNAPIQQRGERKLTGVVTRDGQPVAGAIVTAVAAHGDEVLSDLPCKCDNHCGQMLLACGCAEASGQLVELVASRTGEGVPLARATSAADGSFTLSGLEATALTLYADGTDAVGWLANVASDASDVKLVMTAGRTIRGKVLTTDEKPAKGALVTAIFSQHSRFFDAVADEKGEFKLGPLPLGKYAVVAMQANLLPDHKQVDEGDTEALTLELSVPRSLSGVVLVDDAPLPGATVKLEGMHRKRTVTTDAKGEFRIERLRPGEYDLTAESPKGQGAANARVGKLEDRTGVTITLGKGEPLEGRVLAASGAPVSEALVSLRAGKVWRKTDTDARGVFRFEGVPPEEQRVYAQKEGFLDGWVLARGGQSGVELRMQDASLLSGLVRSSAGELVASFTVRASAVDGGSENQHRVSKKSSDGGFSLEVFPGEYELSVEAPPLAQQVVKVTAPASDIVVVLEPGAMIRGRVFDFDFAPAEGVGIRARLEGVPGSKATGKSDAEGRFELTGLAAGSWKVEATKREKYMTVWRASAQVTLAKGGSTELTLRPTEGAAFAGVVLSPDGDPVEGAQVMAWSREDEKDEDEPNIGRAITDSQGRFQIRTLAAGKVMVDARKGKQHLDGRPEFTAPDKNVILKLNAGTTISGRVVDSSGKPVTSFKVLHENVETPDGQFKTQVDPRETTIAFDAPGYAQLMRAVKLVPGDNPMGDVVLQRGRPVTGVVRDARTKAPIAGALVDVGLERGDLNFFLDEDLGAVRTDAQGRYKLPAVDTSSTYIFASAEKYARAAQPLNGNAADFELRPAGSLRVRVVEVNGALVRTAFPMAMGPNEEVARLMPDFEHEGVFKSEALTPGSWTVSVYPTDAKTFRPQTVTVGEAQVEVVMREATDGVTIEVKVLGGADSVALMPGTLTSPDEMKRTLGYVDLRSGVGRNVLPGQYTVAVFRRGSASGGEASMHPIEVKPTGNPVWTITPQWKPLPERQRP